MIEAGRQGFIKQSVLQGTKISASAEVEVLLASAFLEDVGQAVVVVKANALDHGIAQDHGAGPGGMQAAFNVASAVAVRGVLGTEAAALMVEMPVWAMPDAECRIDVGPERVVVDMIGGLTG